MYPLEFYGEMYGLSPTIITHPVRYIIRRNERNPSDPQRR